MSIKQEKVLSYLSAMVDGLSPTDRSIGEYLLSDPGRFVQMPVKDLAAALGLSDATIVRFCRKVGYDGLLDLKRALRRELLQDTETVTPQTREILVGDTRQDVAQKIALTVNAAVQRTIDLIDPGKVPPVIDLLVNARRVVFVGFGASGLAALEARDKMNRIGIDSDAFIDRFAMTLKLANLKSDDVVVAFSHSGETPEVVNAFKLAQKAGAKRLAITRRPRSPLTELCDHVLLSCGDVQSYQGDSIGTRASQLFLIEFLCTEITKHNFRNVYQKGIPINELLLKERIKRETRE